MELTVVRSGSSSRLLVPKSVAAKLGWKGGDVLQLAVKGDELVIEGLGRGRISVAPLRRRLNKFGGSYAVTLPRGLVTAERVEARIEGGCIRIKLK